MTMTADVERPPTSELPFKAPFTVDLLFELPDSPERYEVLEGQLVVSAAPAAHHNVAADRLRTLIDAALPVGVEAITAVAVRLPGDDGPIPDLIVTTVNLADRPLAIPAEFVHTVVEVVSPSHPSNDRLLKRKLYAGAGIPCYWRVELDPWSAHPGPVPAIVVRMLGETGQWKETIYPAGITSTIPFAIGRMGSQLLTLKLDPADLIGPSRR
jgi:Uma2 family endonuclease